jgi:hypothetical protein
MDQPPPRPHHDWPKALRSGEWFEYKLAPVLGIFFLVALSRGASLLALLPAALALLVAIASCAAFVSILNDLTDVADDRAGGKVNRMAGRSLRAAALLLVAPLLPAAAVMWLWRDNPLLIGAWLGSWIAFLLYSVPPVRLKGRGFPGIVADAAGAHLFPTLSAILLAGRTIGPGAGTGIDPAILASALVWALAWGMRGIVRHQLRDAEADRASRVGTFVARRSPAAATRLVEHVLFPVEALALGALLIASGSWAACLFLLVYLCVAALEREHKGGRSRILRPRPGVRLILCFFYAFWFPVAVMLQSALRHPQDLVALLLFLALFNRHPRALAGRLRRGWAGSVRPA